MAVYVRRAHHFLPDGLGLVPTFDVATVEIAEKYQGKGYWAAFIRMAETLVPEFNFRYIYVESVHNPKLAEGLKKHGYLVSGESLYKKL